MFLETLVNLDNLSKPAFALSIAGLRKIEFLIGFLDDFTEVGVFWLNILLPHEEAVVLMWLINDLLYSISNSNQKN